MENGTGRESFVDQIKGTLFDLANQLQENAKEASKTGHADFITIRDLTAQVENGIEKGLEEDGGK